MNILKQTCKKLKAIQESKQKIEILYEIFYFLKYRIFNEKLNLKHCSA